VRYNWGLIVVILAGYNSIEFRGLYYWIYYAKTGEIVLGEAIGSEWECWRE